MLFRLASLLLALAWAAPACAQFTFGCTNPFACNYDSDATIDDGSCAFSLEGVVEVDEGPAIPFAPAGTTLNLYWEMIGTSMNVIADGPDGSTTPFNASCGCNAIRTTAQGAEDWETGLFFPDIAYWNVDFVAIEDQSGTMTGTNEQVTVISNTSNNFFCYAGCKDPVACNYDPFSAFNDLGLCNYGGCTDATACNYNENASCDDGSCVYSPSCGEGGCRDVDGFEVGFVGAYGSGWDLVLAPQQNSSIQLADDHMYLRSPNFHIGGPSDIYASHETNAGDLTVDWSWSSVDILEGESPYYAIDGVKTYLNTPGNFNENGSLSLTFSAGQEIRFGIESDGQNGRSVLRLSNLRYQGQVCGCTDELFCNYDPAATLDDGSCCGNCLDLTVGGGTNDADISWELLSITGEVIESGGAGTFDFECLLIDQGCYYIRMLDAGGDGWNGATWSSNNGYGISNSGTLDSGSEGTVYLSYIGVNFVDCEPELGCNLLQACNYDVGLTLDLNACAFPECDDPAAVNYFTDGCTGPCYYQTNACGDLVNAQGQYLELAGPWSPDNWNTAYGGTQSLLEQENGQALQTPSQIWLACHESLIDPDDQGYREVQRYILAPSPLTLTFDYAYIPRDLAPDFEEGYSTAFVNAGGRVPLNALASAPASGTMTVSVEAGDTLGFGLESEVTIYGRDVLHISNLRYDAPGCGCTDAVAVNFDPFAQSDAGTCLFASTCEGLADASGAISGLVMEYAPDNWTATTPGNSAVTLGEHALFLQGNTNGTPGQTASVVLTAPFDGNVRFEWSYVNPAGSPSTDQPFLIHNGTAPLLNDGDLLNTGTVVVALVAGDTFGFELKSDGNAAGPSLLIERMVWESLSCTPGCTYPEAPNYDPSATTDDGSCLPPAPTCASDINGDGDINSQDLLVVLGAFGSSCD